MYHLLGEMPLQIKPEAKATREISCFQDLKCYSEAVLNQQMALHPKVTIPFYFKEV